MPSLALVTASPEDDADDAAALDFLASPPAPLTPRKRNRPPQPGTPASGLPGATAAPSADDHSDPHAERLRVVLEMVAAGKSQADIGRHFGRCKRTIAEWYKEARERRAATFRTTTAEDIAAEIEARFSKSYAQWTSIVERAQSTGNLKLEIMAMARMDQSHVQRVQALARIGYFDEVQFKPMRDMHEDSHTRSQSALSMLHMSLDRIAVAGTRHDGMFGNTDDDEMQEDKGPEFPFY